VSENKIIFTSLTTGAVVIKQNNQYQIYLENRLVRTMPHKDSAVMAAIGYLDKIEEKKTEI